MTKYLKHWAHLAALGAVLGMGGSAQAGGSSGGYIGGYGSSGGYAATSGYGSSGGSTGYSGYGSSGGYAATAGYGSSGGSTGYAAAYSGGSSGGADAGHVGPLRRLAARLRAHHAGKQAARSGGSSGGVSAVAYHGGSSGGSSGGYAPVYSGGSSGGSSGGYMGGYGGGVTSYSIPLMVDSMNSPTYEAPVVGPAYGAYPSYTDSVSTTPLAPRGPSYTDDLTEQASYEAAKPAIDEDAALLTVAVPSDDAEVTVNGHPTKSEGSIRQFMSRGLKPGFLYTYVVDVKYTLGGKLVTDTRTVKLRPGDTERLVFEAAADEPVANVVSADVVETVVELHVPENAEVTLAGNPTRGQGAVRTFRTKQLKAGERWENYTVVVTAVVDGRSVTQQRTVSVEAGDHTELEFSFDPATVAVR